MLLYLFYSKHSSQPNIPQTSTHTHRHHYSHVPNKQLDDADKQRR